MAALNGKDDVTVGFGATTGGLRSGAAEAARLVKDATAAMRGSFDGLLSAVGGVTKGFVGIGVALAGGALFKSVIADTLKFTTEVASLSRVMGLTTKEASAMAVAVDDAFLSMDELRGATQAMDRQLRTNERGLNSYGVVTRDVNKNLLSQRELLFNSLNALRQYKGGTDQLLAAQSLLGRSMTQDVLQKMFDMQEKFEATKTKVSEFAQVVGAENVKAAKAFKVAQNDVGDAIQGTALAIGNSLVPVLTSLAGIFANFIGSLIPAIKVGFQGIAIVLSGVTDAAYFLFQVLKGAVLSAGEGILGLGRAVTAFFTGDIKGAEESMKSARAAISARWSEVGDNIEAAARRGVAARKLIMEGPEASMNKVAPPEGTRSRAGGRGFVQFDKGAAKDALEQMKMALKAMELAESDYHDLSKARERDYWQSKLTVFAKGSKEAQEVNILYLTARRQAAQEALQAEKENLDRQQAAAGNDAAVKVEYTVSWLARVTQLYGEDSKQFRDALAQKEQAERDYAAQQKGFLDQRAEATLAARQATIDIAQDEVRMLVDLGAITRENGVQMARELVEARYQILVEDLERRKLLYAADLVEQEKINGEKVKLDAEMSKELARSNQDMTIAVRTTWDEMFGGLFGTLKSVTQGLLQGTMTWKAAMGNIANSVLNTFVEMGFKRLQAWIYNEFLMLSASRAAAGSKALLDASGAATSIATKGTEATTKITAEAGVAAAGAASSQASIPFIGPVLAAAAAVAMLALVLGFKNGGGGGGGGGTVPSAAGGWWDIPQDTLAMVHQKEMIMPAELSEGVRSAVENGTGLGGGVSVVINATDAQSVANLFRNNKAALAGALAEQMRNMPGRKF